MQIVSNTDNKTINVIEHIKQVQNYCETQDCYDCVFNKLYGDCMFCIAGIPLSWDLSGISITSIDETQESQENKNIDPSFPKWLERKFQIYNNTNQTQIRSDKKELIEETLIERTQNILLKEKEHFIEIDIKLPDGRLIGTAEIEPNEKMLERFTIFEPYQNLKYGQQALSELIDAYGIKKLWVRSDNEKAIHIYKKAGFKKNKETMFEMSI